MRFDLFRSAPHFSTPTLSIHGRATKARRGQVALGAMRIDRVRATKPCMFHGVLVVALRVRSPTTVAFRVQTRPAHCARIELNAGSSFVNRAPSLGAVATRVSTLGEA
jgi:hypothetical protein